MKLRGRTWFGIWLVYFLLVMGTVVARQTSAFVANQTLRDLQEDRRVLESTRNTALRRIQQARSRSGLSRRARELGLRDAADDEVIDVRVPVAGR